MAHEELHKHTHEHECCDHEHSHDHEHDHCGCHEHGRGHEHGHGDGCGCGHDHGAGADRGAVIRLIVSASLFVLSLIPQPYFWVTLLLSIAAVLPVGIPVLLEAVEEWKDRRIGENTLLLVALPAAFAIGEYREGAMVALLFALGELLEDLAVGRSNRALTALAEIRPDTAIRLNADGSRQEVEADDIRVGDRLLVPAHGRVAVDGIVLSGQSHMDTAALTGESLPVPVGEGDAVLSGSINGDGVLEMRATAAAGRSAAARVIELVAEASAQKGQSQRFITRFAARYTPAVMILAVLLTLIPVLCGGELTTWLYRSLVFLVASCPCAMVISVPLGFYAGIGAASKRGVLIKGGRYVEMLAAVKAVAMDKTGTLTTGVLTVEEAHWTAEVSEEEGKGLLLSVESLSAHPAAKALKQYAAGAAEQPVTELRELPGLGVSALWQGKKVLCGNRRLLDERGIVPISADAAVWLTVDGREAAAFTLGSVPRPEAAEAVKELHELGVDRVAMVTGDARAAALRTAEKVGIREVSADQMPEDKQRVLSALKQACGTAAFVGDGINDAPVLAMADVGVAMGFGSTAALEAGDVILMGDRLTQLPMAIRLSRRILRTVQVNVGFALLVKASVLVLAAFGLAPMWAAVFADVGVSMLCILNAMHLLWGGKKEH